MSVDRNGDGTKYKCPFLSMVDPKDEKNQPRITLVYGVYNFAAEKVQILQLNQKTILRALNSLSNEIAAMKSAKGKPKKRLKDFKISIARIDGDKVIYNVGFAMDASDPPSPEEMEAVDLALDPSNPDCILKRIQNDTQWPDEAYLEKIGFDLRKIDLPHIADMPQSFSEIEAAAKADLTEEDVPF